MFGVCGRIRTVQLSSYLIRDAVRVMWDRVDWTL